MEAMPERSCRRFSGANNFRNTFGPLMDPQSKTSNWQSEIYPHYDGANNSNLLHPREFTSDHNMMRFTTESKLSSDELSPVDLEINEIDNYPDYQTGEKIVRKKRCEKKRRDLGYSKIENNSIEMNQENYQRIKNSGTVEVGPADQFAGVSAQGTSKTLIAEEKLKKLKELQRRREFNERYYSHEIRKLINEYYKSTAKNSGDSVLISLNNDNENEHENENENENEKKNEKANIQRQISTVKDCGKIGKKNLLIKSLEPCGTMTMITRLDCGCMQETTRPIFTTPKGKIESRNCPHSENISTLNLKLHNSSNLPREHLLISSNSNFIQPQSRLTSRRKFIVANSNSNSKNFNPYYSGVVNNNHSRQPRIDHKKYSLQSTAASTTLRQELSSKNPAARCNSEMSPKPRLIKRPGTTASSSLVRDNRHQNCIRNLSPLRKYSDTSTD